MEGPTPKTPYREGKPLADIIPPDRRRAKTAALVVASMLAGVTLWQLGGWALETMRRDTSVTVPLTPGYAAGRITPGVLRGPGGAFPMPPPSRTVIHVWLQGCLDCMSAFEAMRDLEDEGGLGLEVPVLNVAYGEADATWAARYRVDRNLVFDVGGATLVKPLGIGTFTTLVVDSSGSIIHRDRPDRPGYRDRVRAAVGEQHVTALEPTPTPPPPHQNFDHAAVERVVAAHRSGVKRACWDTLPEPKPQAINVTVSFSVGTDGKVSYTNASGDAPEVAMCIGRHVKTWVFPAPESSTTVNVPFKFAKQ